MCFSLLRIAESKVDIDSRKCIVQSDKHNRAIYLKQYMKKRYLLKRYGSDTEKSAQCNTL